MQFRPSTLAEREEFYKYEFHLAKAMRWLEYKPQLFAVDLGSETGIIKDKTKKDEILNIYPYHLKQKLIEYLPEDVYYDRNQYKDVELIMKTLKFKEAFGSKNCNMQELAFDIDPENIPCRCKSEFPKFCNVCMRKTVSKAVKLGNQLKKQFKKVKLVYSGRGMHVHVLDGRAFHLTMKQREDLNKKFINFDIDPWVSRGRIRLIRLPYSLNALVSRIVLPLTFAEAEDFDPVTSKKTIPKFLT